MVKCAACSFENPPDAGFCQECGQPLERQCPSCGKPVTPSAKFCSGCGQRLVTSTGPGSTAAAPISPVGSAAPVAPTPRRLPTATRTTAGEGERKLVTLLFTDIVGSTAMAERLDPEEWGEIVSGAHRRVSEAIERRDGTIAQLLGDGVLAFFGAPVTHEDDPVRAVAAAFDILTSIRVYARELADTAHIGDFRMRVGLNTGLVVVGNVGSELHLEYLAVGDSVNLAARLQSAAEPDSILISASTARLVRHAFVLDSRGLLELKGKAEPIAAFRVVGPKATPESARGVEGLFSPLVGRGQELSVLRQRVGELAGGRGQIVSIMGEAGLGKSRLLAELKALATTDASEISSTNGRGDAISRQDHVHWLEGRALSDQSTTAYAPFSFMLKRWFDVVDLADDRARYDCIKEKTAEILPRRVDEVAPLLATLVGVSLEGDAFERVRYLEPPVLRGRIVAALSDYVLELARSRPTVLVFEDLHWTDSSSLELVEQLLPLTERAPLMVVGVFRPQRQEPAWRFHQTAEESFGHRYSAISLEPLNEDNARQLVANLLHVEDLPERVRALILRKSEGNPFFVEEMIRSLLDAKLVVRDGERWRATREIATIAVPDTLSALIGARLDRLDPASKKVAQTASVIGREFELDLLTNAGEWAGDLDESLATLQRRELIDESARAPDLVYRFKHALTQEAAYASLLLSRRREIHRLVAACLERRDPRRVNDIARHFVEAREDTRALPYLVEAGDRSSRAYATPEAIGYYRRAIDILKTTDDRALARRAFEGLGAALMLANNLQGAAETYHAMLGDARDHGDVPMRVSALNKLAATLMWLGRFPEVEGHLVDSEHLARAHQDVAGLAELYWVRCGVCTLQADFSRAVEHLGQSVKIGRDLNLPDQLAFGLTHTANTLAYMTRFDEMWEKAQEGLQVAREIGNLKFQAEILAFPVPTHYLREGDLPAALRAAEESNGIARRIGASLAEMVSALVAASIAHLRGEYERAIAGYESALQAGRAIGWPFLEVPPLASLGTAYFDISPRLVDRVDDYHRRAMTAIEVPGAGSSGGQAWLDLGLCALAKGNVDLARDLFDKGLSIPTMFGQLNRPGFLIGQGMVALHLGQPDVADRYVSKALAFAEERSMRNLFPLLALAAARVHAASGRNEAALEHLSRAESLAQDMNMRPLAVQACAEAAKILDTLGRPAEAEEKRARARGTVGEIAGLFADATLRDAYLESATAAIKGQTAIST